LCGLKFFKKAKTRGSTLQKFLWNMIYESEAPYTNGSSKNPQPVHPLCQFSEFEEAQFIGIFNDPQFELKTLIRNRDRFYQTSKMLIHLGLTKKIFFPAVIYPLHTMSNLMKLSLNTQFYVMMSRMKKEFDINTPDLFNSIILNNELTKCIYTDNFKKKTGFNFEDL
jgi:hypothetical protein